MRKLSSALAVTVIAAAAMPHCAAAEPVSHVKAGSLACDVSAGIGSIVTSQKAIICMFVPAQPGPREVYVGAITKFGLDKTTTSGEMIWAVYAPAGWRHGALAGHYSGGKTLVGGDHGAVNLQPVSFEAQAGLNLAAGVSELNLMPAR